MRKIIPLLILAFAITLSINNCWKQDKPTSFSTIHDLQQIKDSGRLTVITLYSSTTYVIYRGESMGFQYELAEQFADELGVALEVKIAPNVQEMQRMLLDGEGA